MNLLRIGFLSAAGIGRKNWKGVYHSGNCVITAVASRDVAKARSYIEALQSEAAFSPAPVALGSYEELLASKKVDAVYIPLPTGLRKEWVIRAAQAGKHVICEKPCATRQHSADKTIKYRFGEVNPKKSFWIAASLTLFVPRNDMRCVYLNSY